MDKPTRKANGIAARADEARRAVSAQAVRAGDHAPDFSLPDHNGIWVSLATMVANGPVILSFLDGWNPADADAQFQALIDCVPQVALHGASVLAVSPAARACPPGTGTIHLLRDAGSVVAERYRLCPSANAGAVPATFIINQDSMIVLSLIDGTQDGNLICAVVASALAALRRIKDPKP